MFNLYNDTNKKVHFIGIGGISMSGLAEILLDYGYTVSGSDRAESRLTNKLQSLGATVYIGHNKDNIGNADLVVYTAAVGNDNEELVEANKRGIEIMDRAEFLGYIMKGYSKSIAVSGTHGKTTTTSMISLMLLNQNLDPTIMVGGELDAIGGNIRSGKSSYLIAEACEYKRSFLKFRPYIGVILNIEADHLDYYKDIEEIQDTFQEFAGLIPEDGALIGCADDERVLKILNTVSCRTISYGIKSGDFVASDIEYSPTGCASFTVMNNGMDHGRFSLSVPGEHNVLNALAAIACGSLFCIEYNTMEKSLEEFRGTHRRFEKKGEINGITVIDDYAHHPSEIIATLNATQNYPHKRLYCIFQPHTYSRTYTLFKDFSKSFNGVDKLLLLDIYAAREKDTGLVSSKMLCDEVRKNGVDAIYMSSFDEAVAYLKSELEEGDVLITMGAGDVYKVGEDFLNN